MSAKQKQFDTLNIEDVRVTVVLRSIFSGFKFEIESNDEKHFFSTFSFHSRRQNEIITKVTVTNKRFSYTRHSCCEHKLVYDNNKKCSNVCNQFLFVYEHDGLLSFEELLILPFHVRNFDVFPGSFFCYADYAALTIYFVILIQFSGCDVV